MAEAIRRVHETTSQAQRAAIITLARQRAIKAVQQHLQSQGRRWRDMVRRDLVVMANDYLATHPAELIAEAAETVRTNPKLRTLVARQARQLARNRSSKTHAPKPPRSCG
jgi:predicted P-loop ATPase